MLSIDRTQKITTSQLNVHQHPTLIRLATRNFNFNREPNYDGIDDFITKYKIQHRDSLP